MLNTINDQQMNFSELSHIYYNVDKKTKNKIDKQYKNFVGSMVCCVSKNRPVHLHHVRTHFNSGMGKRPDDIFCIPLNHEYHTGDKGIHILGEKTFCNRFDIDLCDTLKEIHLLFIERFKNGS